MKYKTINEITTFDFSQSKIVDIKTSGDKLIFDLTDVIIDTTNSCNEEVEKMGTEELTLTFTVSDIEACEDGYTVYNNDDTVYEKVEDKVIPVVAMPQFYEDIKDNFLAGIEFEDGEYRVLVDTEDPTVSYTIKIKATEDNEEWDAHHRLPAHLR